MSLRRDTDSQRIQDTVRGGGSHWGPSVLNVKGTVPEFGHGEGLEPVNAMVQSVDLPVGRGYVVVVRGGAA